LLPVAPGRWGWGMRSASTFRGDGGQNASQMGALRVKLKVKVPHFLYQL
jgi:hypothetical protein